MYILVGPKIRRFTSGTFYAYFVSKRMADIRIRRKLNWSLSNVSSANSELRRMGQIFTNCCNIFVVTIYNRYFVTTLTSSGHIGSFIPGGPLLIKIEVCVHLMYLRIYVKFCVIELIDFSRNCILTR